MNKLLIGLLYAIVAHVLTFLQLQGNIKYGWFQKYPVIVLVCSIPISYLFIKSVENFVLGFNGEIWAPRLLGFGVGTIVFTIMSWGLFKEPFTIKTGVSILLALTILLIQIYWK